MKTSYEIAVEVLSIDGSLKFNAYVYRTRPPFAEEIALDVKGMQRDGIAHQFGLFDTAEEAWAYGKGWTDGALRGAP